MEKIKIIIVVIIAICGALLIYNKFTEKAENIKIEYKNINSEYTLVEKDNVFKYKNIEDVIKIVQSGSGVIFLCSPESDLCQQYAESLDKASKEANLNEIVYCNIKSDRSSNNVKYQKLVSLLNDYLSTDDLNNKTIYMPEVLFIYNGKVINHDNTHTIDEENDLTTRLYNKILTINNVEEATIQ
jgi:hypothetical protein